LISKDELPLMAVMEVNSRLLMHTSSKPLPSTLSSAKPGCASRFRMAIAWPQRSLPTGGLRKKPGWWRRNLQRQLQILNQAFSLHAQKAKVAHPPDA
jgi:hypothetical protein